MNERINIIIICYRFVQVFMDQKEKKKIRKNRRKFRLFAFEQTELDYSHIVVGSFIERRKHKQFSKKINRNLRIIIIMVFIKYECMYFFGVL